MRDDLYEKIICALLHDMNACEICKKCGLTGAEVRMNLVSWLCKEEGKEFPWSTNNDRAGD